MKIETYEKSSRLLVELANAIKKTIEDGISSGVLEPENETYFRWKINDFKYDDSGPQNTGAAGEYITKKSWLKATMFIENKVKNSPEYRNAFEHLKKIFDDKMSEQSVERFVHRISSDCLYERKIDDQKIASLVENLHKGLKNEPLLYGAEVFLEGVVLRPDTVNPAHGIILRKTLKEDLQKETPYYSMAHFPHNSLYPIPSAILKIEFLGTRGNETQKKVDEAITLLRLFKVGSIKYISYKMYTDSFGDPLATGTHTSGDTAAAYEKYLINEEDVELLKRFWENLQPLLSKSLGWPSSAKEDHVTIAYKRYSDSLLHNGLIERRIANAVMGLEGLLLKAGELQELPYRLSNRAAKVFAVLERDPLEIKKVIVDAYKVRNLFVHGSQLSYDQRKKYENKYKDVKNLFLHVLDYLRMCIVVYLTLNLEKNAFIDIIDDSFVDKKREEQLRGVLNSAKYVFVVN